MLFEALNPYMLYVKLGLIILSVLAVLGVTLYVKHVFTERTELANANHDLKLELLTAQKRYEVAMEEVRVWKETVDKMNKAVRNIRVQNSNYISGVEHGEAPVIPAGGSIPLIVSGASARDCLPGFTLYSTNRRTAAASGRKPLY